MPGLAQRNDHFSNTFSTNGFWSKHRNDVSYNQLQKFWSELSPQARQELLRIDKQTLFEQARKNMYCSRCNGLLLEGFLQIVMYGKSLQQEGAGGHFPSNRSGALKNQKDTGSDVANRCLDEIQDPSVHPWGGLTTTRDGTLTLLDCYLYAKSLKGLQNVFDSARARERERELLYPDACGGGGRGWISQGMASYGRGHGTRETCALHTARLSCDTLVDFWSALGEETRQSLLRMKEEDFIERLMYRFDSKRFCRDCRRNVIREFKELKELKRIRREPRCTSWFCVADTAFQYEVSDDTVQVDWRQTFTDTVGIYHHFEWAVGTGEGKSDILEFENVGMNGSVQVNGLDLGGLIACYITLRAWKLDGRCTELSVKAHALKGEQCVHGRLVVGDGFVTILRGESIRRFFEHAEEAEEEEDDDSMDKDGNELDGECSRPQKHAKSPELAREFLLDAATVIFKEQVEKAFREGTARQNAHSIFVCLALKLLEERVHVACKEIITLEKQTKLLEEEEKEKREEEERKERRRAKEREKKLRRKERLKGKEREREKKCSESDQISVLLQASTEESWPIVDEEPINTTSARESVCETSEIILSRPQSPDTQEYHLSNGYTSPKMQDHSYDDTEGNDSFTIEHSKYTRRRLKFRKEYQVDPVSKWSDRRRFTAASEGTATKHVDNSDTPRIMNGLFRQPRTNTQKSNTRNCGSKYNDKFHSHSYHSCCCNQNNDYRAKVEPATRPVREVKSVSKSESTSDMFKQFYRGGSKYNQVDHMRESCGRSKTKIITATNPSSRDSVHTKKVWEPMDSQRKYPRSNSDSDVTLCSSTFNGEAVEADTHNGETETNQEVNSSDPITSSTSNSDNCSSCLSEGDSNTASSNPQNLESSSTSDSEDASQQSEGRETETTETTETSVQNEKQKEEDPFINPKTTVSMSMDSQQQQHQGMLPPMHNHNMHYPMFQAPSYFPQTWPATPANGILAYPHPNHYLFTSPLSYGLNGNSRYCMQYGAALQPLTNPLMNSSHVPVYHPIEQAKVCKKGVVQEEVVPHPVEASPPSGGENGKKDGKNERNANTNFSLFHFGGPVALTGGYKSNPEEVFPTVENGENGCNMKESTTIEEYNLFAASNGIRFSFF